jgi:hypothetical protein
MAFSNFPIKSVLLKGRLRDSANPVTYRLCPGTEFSEGKWNLSLISLSYNIIENPQEQINKEVFSISCNQVKGHKYSNSYEVESYNQPLSTFVLDHKIKELKKDIAPR